VEFSILLQKRNSAMPVELPYEIQGLLNDVQQNFPSISEIWLIGSRANNIAREDSDWDFLVFGNDNSLNKLKSMIGYKRENVDFLVIFDGDNFIEPWGEPKKSGSLTKWEWNRTSDYSAEYKQIKFIPDSEQEDSDLESGTFVEKIVNAIKVLPKTT
jgi:predicted nucleotidyltransferase